MALFFKHCDYLDVERWGAICLPNRQQGQSFMSNVYQRGARVLLALHGHAAGGLAEHIFTVCTLDPTVRPTAELVGPEVARMGVIARWKSSVAIEQLWRVTPLSYEKIASGRLREKVACPRGVIQFQC